MSEISLVESEVTSVLKKYWRGHVHAVERIHGGRNSRVFGFVDGDGTKYVAKFYFAPTLTGASRLDVEYLALQFMWEGGIRCIPRPLFAAREHEFAIYSFVEGEKLTAQDISDLDLTMAINFLTSLKILKEVKESKRLPKAAEACFSVEAILQNIQSRLHRLRSFAIVENAETQDLPDFLITTVIPFLAESSDWAEQSCKKYGISFADDLTESERTLSPSDFGFHNALKQENGQVIFLDFEYFGWDDPAKMISDFLLHPGMELPLKLRLQFVRQMLERFRECGNLVKRMEIVYPLFAIKWCLILLNEFVPEDLCRRGFASGEITNKGALQRSQLEKANNILQKVKYEYRKFPYANE